MHVMRYSFISLTFLAVATAVGLFLANPSRLFAIDASRLTRASIASDGTEANQDSGEPQLNADGRFLVFSSSTDNLAPGHKPTSRDIYLRDRLLNLTTVVNRAPDGAPAAGGRSEHPSISDNGRFIVYSSYADNLAPNDANNAADIFLYDREEDRTTCISVSPDGKQADGDSICPTISGNNRWVVYASKATNLTPGDTNAKWDIFVYDRITRATERVSVSTKKEQGNGDSGLLGIDIDDNGRYVVFASEATNLAQEDTNGVADIFLRDRFKDTGETRRVSISSEFRQANGKCFSPSINGRGRYIGYISVAANLVPDDTNGCADIFIFDFSSATTRRINISTDMEQADQAAGECDLDRSGRFVAFSSAASNLAPNDTGKHADIFLRDRQERVTSRINLAPDGMQADGLSSDDRGGVSINADGRFVAFRSVSTNLVAGDANNKADIFIYDRTPELGEPMEWETIAPVVKLGPPTREEIEAARAVGTRQAVIKTARGVITLELYGDKAPLTVANFVKLATAHFYDGLTFHRVEKDPQFALIQGGDPQGNGVGGPGYSIRLEIAPELTHVTGTLAMARSQNPNSAGSQFYITLCPIHQLDKQYAVFGKVVLGLDVVKKIRVDDKIIAIEIF